MKRVRVFSRVRREANAWIKTPSADSLAQVASTAHMATEHVPETRRADWETLLNGFGSQEGPPKRRARVEGLLRACTLFEREERDRRRSETRVAWDDPVNRAEGLGPTAREKLAAQGVTVIADLLWTLPAGWDDLRAPLGVSEAVAMARAREGAPLALAPAPRQCIRGTVKSATLVPMRGRRALRVVLADETGNGSLDAWWFYAAHGVLAVARPGTACVLVGHVRTRDQKRPTMAHPDLVRLEDSVRGVRPYYPRLGVAPATLRRAIRDAMARTSPLPDPVPAAVAARESMPGVEPLLRNVHAMTAGEGISAPEPTGDGAATILARARGALANRLAWVEAFARVWQRILAEQSWGRSRAPVLPPDARALAQFVDALGFAPTDAQRRAIATIAKDLASSVPMRRLLLGDVGTGKTAVALAAAAQCVAAGFQCALLAPTGLLAEQYVEAAAPLVRALGTRLERVTAGMRAAERRSALAAIASGEAQLAVGTHALLEQDVAFARLGLVVVDEQQRLGVAQRLTLVRKGQRSRPHLLSLSATPIPRTLALALRGELSTSVLDERPLGRGIVVTELRARARLDAVLDEVRSATASGDRVFFVCSHIEGDDEDETGAQARAEYLARALAPATVTVVHGAMPAAERTRAMRAFRRGEALILVGTTVIEVGLDVPEATLMVVDGAERFGLAQLHQLRGRVGRGDRPGRCLLVHDDPLTDLARRRLEMLVTTNDGAEIARADLSLRGAGDLGGTRQSGVIADFSWLDPSDPPAWIDRIEGDAREIFSRDQALAAPEHRALALALRRFATAAAVREEAG
jgi:ATP-dependent DNA helicase RecG